jgi:hypothetical protein
MARQGPAGSVARDGFRQVNRNGARKTPNKKSQKLSDYLKFLFYDNQCFLLVRASIWTELIRGKRDMLKLFFKKMPSTVFE